MALRRESVKRNNQADNKFNKLRDTQNFVIEVWHKINDVYIRVPFSSSQHKKKYMAQCYKA